MTSTSVPSVPHTLAGASSGPSTGTDRQIAARALPRPAQEAAGVRNAHIDAVPGADRTGQGQGHIRSLQSAPEDAHA
ncbi:MULTISPECIES: hypothetical protein [unclassified Streptomyces]|uniref:hypothetical protein n=1 Tax=unclassified Streptomyces TaxID=2593676 RepID=UPI002E2024EA|nr:hypothetical protein OG217_06185 [Streptomyces sp. NBC_01023]